MHKRLFLAVSLLVISAAPIFAQPPAQQAPAGAQQNPAGSMSGGDMGGMDMSSPASPSQSSNQPSSSQSDDKSKSTSDECPCMKMMMKMESGADKSKSMDMDKDMNMGKGESMDMDKDMDMGKGESMEMSSCMKMMHGGMKSSDAAPVPAGSMRIAYGGKTADWSQSTLAALPHSKVTIYDETAKANETYSGVPLLDLLARLGVNEKPSGKDVMLYVVAAGKDGYSALYSLGEIAPYIHDASVIVADSAGGKPLAASGPFELIASREKHPARWVKNLVSIKVVSAQ